MNLNKVFLIGRLTQDPEARQTPSGQNVTNINMATNRVWNDASGRKEATEYHRVIAWGRLGEIANNYLKKGGMVYIEGRMQTRQWTGKDGQKRYTTEVVAENLQLGPKAAGFSGGSEGSARSVSNQRPTVTEANDDQIPVIEPDAPLHNPIGKEPATKEEEGEIDLKDIPF